MEVEDDEFFADLSKQISLLIMDDDEDHVVSHCPPVSLNQAFSVGTNSAIQSPFLYEQSCRRESKGTGVFIPRCSYPRRKNKQGKTSSSKKQYSDNSRGFNPHSSNPKNC